MSILEAVHRIGIPAREVPISAEELSKFDEIFTCHTGIKVRPFARLEDRELEAPGPVTGQVTQLMNGIIEFKDERFVLWIGFNH